ncbi:retron Eco8 family effector endonuclease [Paenibacillus sp. FSL H3-0469]|uniref:retron Eco8 family effector endonuclease n=1 Tax=Paenibacillus sp. FSL H3-0469 TaxID=2954506 RepID=UPI003101401B
MSISKIQFRNLKSLKNIDLSLTDFNCLIGENGSGKSNVLKALAYFYNNLTENNLNFSLFDKNNPFNDFIEIKVTYNLNRLIKITQNNVDRQLLEEIHPFFRRVLDLIFHYVSNDNHLRVELRQYRNNIVQWNVPYEVRNFLKNNFPIYLIDSRQIKLNDWENLWDIIGDMSKFKAIDDVHFEEEIKGLLKKTYGDKFLKDLGYIQTEFIKSEVELIPFNPNQKFTQIYQMQLGGKQFKHREEHLDYFSDGMNAYNYLKLLVNIVGKMTQAKLKEPLIIVDEPEIGLHPKYTDELVHSFIRHSKAVKVLIATHSPRMIKGVMSSSDASLYHFSLKQKYTLVKKMKGFTNLRENNIMSEKEASFYFSRGILFVEGPTELELFTNKHLRSLFPVLTEIDTYSYDSDNVKLKLTNPIEKNTSIPYLLLLDLDKIIRYDEKTQKFSLKGDSYNPLKNEELERKEQFYYGHKRMATKNLRSRIKGLTKNTTFNPDAHWSFISDDYFSLLKSLIKSYCCYNNVYPVQTTIEGTLINSKNYSLVYKWLVDVKGNKKIKEIYKFKVDDNYRTTTLRLLHSGKYDTLNVPEESKVNEIKDVSVQKIYNTIAENKTKKTDGWVSEFLEYYFNNYIYINDMSEDEKINKFKSHFPELYDIIKFVQKMFQK